MYVNKTKGLTEGKVGDYGRETSITQRRRLPKEANSKEGTRGRGDFERDNLD